MTGKLCLKEVAISLVALAVFTCSAPQAEAQTTPFKITGTGVGPDGLPLPGQPARPHWIIGEATHLGRHYGEGSVRTDTAEFTSQTTVEGQFGSGSPFVFTGANGDKLACQYGRTDKGAEEPGSFVLDIVGVAEDGFSPIVKALWIAEFVVQPELCTGRLVGTTGSWIMKARSEPFVLDVFDVYATDDPVYYSWEGEGKLTFAHD